MICLSPNNTFLITQWHNLHVNVHDQWLNWCDQTQPTHNPAVWLLTTHRVIISVVLAHLLLISEHKLVQWLLETECNHNLNYYTSIRLSLHSSQLCIHVPVPAALILHAITTLDSLCWYLNGHLHWFRQTVSHVLVNGLNTLNVYICDDLQQTTM